MAQGSMIIPPSTGGGGSVPSTAVTGLSSRQVLFGSSAGGIAQSAVVQVDSTVGALGIGTSAPSVLAEIASTAGNNSPALIVRKGSLTKAYSTYNSRTVLSLESSASAGVYLGLLTQAGGGDEAGFWFGTTASEVQHQFRMDHGTTRYEFLVNQTRQFVIGDVTAGVYTEPNIKFGAGTTAPNGMLTARVSTAGGPSLVLQSSAGADQVFVDSSGYVGVGTTTPRGVFDAALLSGTSVAYFGTTGIGSEVRFTGGRIRSAGAQLNIRGQTLEANPSAQPISLAASTVDLASHVFINTSGHVGIGTTAPTAPLHVVGNAQIGGTTAFTVGLFGAAGTTQLAAITTVVPAAVYSSLVGAQLNLVTEAIRALGLTK